jgi:hypothetical protein
MIPLLKHPAQSGQLLKSATVLMIALSTAMHIKAQSVSEIITDYNGYYKTASAAPNPVKPDNSHHLLSFAFNGTRYSTGVNDALLSSHGETFTPAGFTAYP